jgi:nucleoside-diphosphate-sugar epimerase
MSLWWLLLLSLMLLVVVVVLVRRHALPAHTTRTHTAQLPPLDVASHCVLVTGASGFVGRYLVECLLQQQHQQFIIACDLFPPSYTSRWVLNVAMDITDESRVRLIFSTYDPIVVYHLAAIVDTRCGWPHTNTIRRVNVTGATIVARLCREFRDQCVGERFRLVSLSSASAGVLDSDYGRSKRDAEVVMSQSGAIILRPWKVLVFVLVV